MNKELKLMSGAVENVERVALKKKRIVSKMNWHFSLCIVIFQLSI